MWCVGDVEDGDEHSFRGVGGWGGKGRVLCVSSCEDGVMRDYLVGGRKIEVGKWVVWVEVH